MPRNFIPGPNPFNIAAPPTWFLAQLAAYDSELVLFASQESPCYQVARRLQFHRYAKPSERHPDTRVFAIHNLHPVGRLLPSPMTKWGPAVIADLKAMDVDAVGGGDKAADILDRHDREQEEKFALQLDDTLDYAGADAYRYLTKKHHDQKKKSRGAKARRSVPSIGKPNFRPGGSAVFVSGPKRTQEDLARIRTGRSDVDVPPAPPKIVTDVVW